VPGHGKFLKNMLAGVGGIDLAMLVVAADEGPMPQTLQHIKILAILGVSDLLLIISKIDISSPEQIDDTAVKTQQILEEHRLRCLDTVRVSAVTGQGIDLIKPALARALSRASSRESDACLPAFLPIDRVFSKTGYGTVITGTLVRGIVTVGDTVIIEPGHLSGRIRGLESFGQKIDRAQPGQRAAVNLSMKEHVPLRRGQSIFLLPANLCTNLLADFKLLPGDSARDLGELLPGQQVRLYHGTAEVSGNIRWLETFQAPSAGAGAGASEAESAMGYDPLLQRVVGQIKLNEPLIAEPGDKFVLRYGDTGITGGEILIGIRPRWLSRKKLLPLLQAVLARQYEQAIELITQLAPHRLASVESIHSMLPLGQRALLPSMVNDRKLVSFVSCVTTQATRDDLKNKIVIALQDACRGNDATVPGITLEVLRTKAVPFLDRPAFRALTNELVELGLILKNDDRLLPPRTEEQLGAETIFSESLESDVMAVLEQEFCLEIKELATRVRQPVKNVEAALAALAKKERASVVGYEFASCRAALDKAHAALAKLWQAKREISPSDFKESIGVSRKYAMALLAYFDDHQITRRMGNSRVLLKAPKSS